VFFFFFNIFSKVSLALKLTQIFVAKVLR